MFYLILFLFNLIILVTPSKIYSNSTLFNRLDNNILIDVGPSNSWDSGYLRSPSVLWSNNEGEIWYSANKGNYRAIGKARLIFDGNNNLTIQKDSNNPIIKSNFVSNMELGVELPFVIKNINGYNIWFNSVYGTPNYFFKIYSTYFSDGVFSTPKPVTLNINPQTNAFVSPSVIFDSATGIYQLWFGTRSTGDDWYIGYAESKDGDSWTNIKIPIFPIETDWEGNGANSPHVFKDNGLYYMFYDSSKGFLYANSDDGITWRKNKTIRVLEKNSNSNTFDSAAIFDPFVIKINDKYFLFYVGVKNFTSSIWKIGVASTNNIPEVEKPTETPTPTPTVTPTATPTPTIPKNSPIIIIPGLGASWNSKDIISCDTGQSGKWIKTPFVTVYDRLIKTLQKNAKLNQNKDFYVYYYDWRLPLNDQVKKLKTFIDKVTSKSKARLIGHSLGGLLIRGYLTDYPQDDKVYKAMTIGTPHLGTILSYPLWENGEIWFDDLATKIPITQLINYCRVVKTVMNLGNITNGLVDIDVNTYKLMSPRETIVALSPSIESLLPGFDYLKLNGQTVPFSSLKSQNIWLQNHPPDDLRTRLITDTISGSGFDTLRFLDIEPPSAQDVQAGNWLDGKPVNREKDKSGDGTVLSMSSQLNSADNLVINADHIQIIYYDEALKKILEFLNLKEIPAFGIQAVPEADADTAITLMSDKNAAIEAVKPDNQKVVGQDNLLSLFNPLKGNYKLKIKASQSGQAVLQTSWFSKTGGIETDTYVLKLKKNKWNNYLLLYMPENQNKLLMVPN